MLNPINPRTLRRSMTQSVTKKLEDLQSDQEGGEAVKMLLEERDKPGFLCFRNSYWQISLFSIRGRAVPWLPLIVYMLYTIGVCLVTTLAVAPRGSVTAAALEVSGKDSKGSGKVFDDTAEKLKQLSSVTTTIGVALFLLLSFRNNAAFQRWQTGMDRFKNFCHAAKNTCRFVAGTLQSYVAVAGEDEGYDIVLERFKWIMAALEIGRQHLRGEKNERHLLDLLEPEEIEILHANNDPVLYCMYKTLDVDRKFWIQKCNEWFRGCDLMYMEFSACANVYTTPIPFAYISHLRTFLALWLACVPWVYVIYYQWYTIIICLVIGYGIIGVEEAAVEVEQPFGRDFNDIPLDSIVADTYGAIGTYVRLVRDAKNKHLAEVEAAEEAALLQAAGGGPDGTSGGGGGGGGESGVKKIVEKIEEGGKGGDGGKDVKGGKDKDNGKESGKDKGNGKGKGDGKEGGNDKGADKGSRKGNGDGPGGGGSFNQAGDDMA